MFSEIKFYVKITCLYYKFHSSVQFIFVDQHVSRFSNNIIDNRMLIFAFHRENLVITLYEFYFLFLWWWGRILRTETFAVRYICRKL